MNPNSNNLALKAYIIVEAKVLSSSATHYYLEVACNRYAVPHEQLYTTDNLPLEISTTPVFILVSQWAVEKLGIPHDPATSTIITGRNRT